MSNLQFCICFMILKVSVSQFNSDSVSASSFGDNNVVLREPTYFIVASKIVRPNQLYRVGVSLLAYPYPLSIRASLLRNGVDIGSSIQEVRSGVQESLLIKVPPTSVSGSYKLRVEGNTDRTLGGTVFQNETFLEFSNRSMTIMVQTEKPLYHQSQTVRFRAIPVNTELRAFDDAVDVYMVDPKGYVVRRWLSRQSNFGSVSLDYILSDQPVYGQWTIRVVALGQVEEANFFVEEYYQTRFEVNVTMPAFIFETDEYIMGSVMANYTSGSPVRGNLTLQAIMKPYSNSAQRSQGIESTLTKNLTFINLDRSWFRQISLHDTVLDYYSGYYEFKVHTSELRDMVQKLDGWQLKILATVKDRLFDEVVEGFAETRFYNNSIKVSVIGGSPQVFKPAMPFTFYVAVSYHDGSQLSYVSPDGLEVRASVQMRTGGSRALEPRKAKPRTDNPGIWEITLDLRAELGGDKQAKKVVDDISGVKVSVTHTDENFQQATDELQLLTQFSPGDRHIKVHTSTANPTVGEYIIFHVRANYHVESFSYVVLSKSTILLTGHEQMTQPVTTFAVSLSSEMAPLATVVIYHVDKTSQVIADALNFPVNGISRNNFTMKLNPRKDKTGDTVEVVILGEPGSYIGISSIDKAFYGMQAGNELTFSDVIRKMATFDKDFNGTHSYSWTSRDGYADDLVFFQSSTYGIDANRTFELANLVVFTDANVVRRVEFCNVTFGQATCLSGTCYPVEKRCDGFFDCQDRSDENNCATSDRTEMMQYRLKRVNRMLRMYENTWLWKDINIGPHGHFIFNAQIPEIPTHWVVSAFGVSPKLGFGLVKRPAEHAAFKPFYMNVEMPSACRQGEQIGIRVSLFNYLTEPLEVIVVLMNSNEYKFIHVEAFGDVKSYDPRTSYGEHQHLVWIPAQSSTMVHLPIVPAKLGEMTVVIEAKTMVRKDRAVRKVLVEADGIPQYRHTSVLLDLSNRAWFFQYIYVNVTESPIIPYSKERYYVFGSNKARVTVVGDVVGPAFATIPMNATSLLHKPMDCAEQNMFSFAANLYMIKYLRLIRDERKKEIFREYKDAFITMNTLYEKQLSYQNYDGSFSYFRSDWQTSHPSVWLTAFCARILTDANFNEWENYLFVDPSVMAKAVAWLVDHQTPEGGFYEPWLVSDRKTTISSNWQYDTVRFRNISLTAHVLISLTTVRDLPGEIGPRVAVARKRAINWLDRNLDLLQQKGDPYEMAIVSYALMFAKASSAEAAFSILSGAVRREGGFMYWGREAVPLPATRVENQKPFLLPRLPYNYDATNVEATSYALLTYVGRQEYEVEPIVKWLNTQRLTDGGFASTQDTVIAIQALIEYTVRHRIREVTSLTLEVEATSNPNLQKKFYISEKNLAVPQSIDIPNAWGSVRIQARGSGFAILNLHLQYNVDQPRFVTQPPVPAFSLLTKAFMHGRNSSHISFNSCQRWTNIRESNISGMAVLEVAVPTGYIIQQQTLDNYTLSGQVRNLRYAKFLQSKVAFYFDYLDTVDTCVKFTLERWHPVANMTRHLSMRVYEYYAPERFNETIFDAFQLYVLDICQVCGSYQCPYCPLYSWGLGLHPSPLLLIAITVLTLLTKNLVF